MCSLIFLCFCFNPAECLLLLPSLYRAFIRWTIPFYFAHMHQTELVRRLDFYGSRSAENVGFLMAWEIVKKVFMAWEMVRRCFLWHEKCWEGWVSYGLRKGEKVGFLTAWEMMRRLCFYGLRSAEKVGFLMAWEIVKRLGFFTHFKTLASGVVISGFVFTTPKRTSQTCHALS